MVRAMGIEPTSHAWEAHVLPLNDARKEISANIYHEFTPVKENKSKKQT